MVYIINSPVLTSFGKYDYRECTVDEIKRLLNDKQFISAVGHNEIAKLLTRIVGKQISLNRIEIHQKPGDCLVVIKPKERLDFNKIYSENDIESIGYELGMLTRIK